MRLPLKQLKVSLGRFLLIAGCILLFCFLISFWPFVGADEKMAHSTLENGSSHSEMDMMPMYFTFANPAHILFKPWSPKTDGEMVGAVFAVFFLAVFYEGLKRGRQQLYIMEARRNAALSGSTDEFMGAVAPSTGVKSFTAMARRVFRRWHLLQTLLHGVQFVLAYFLMLAVMTFSVWLFLGMILGAMFGYFVFDWHPATGGYSSLQNDHCH